MLAQNLIQMKEMMVSLKHAIGQPFSLDFGDHHSFLIFLRNEDHHFGMLGNLD
jgi:hypothetical protein